MTAKKSEQLKVLFGLYYVNFSSILYFCLNKIASVLTKSLLLTLLCYVFKELPHGNFKALAVASQAGICIMYCWGMNAALSLFLQSNLGYQLDCSTCALLYRI